ncbi:MAG TPA: hypothetical protein VFB34_03755 [Chloroflexota bacterium]|nr:hypothetical protein [Chloroflexota bacterium]
MLDLRQNPTLNGATSPRSYQNDLRAIGRYADDNEMQHIGLYEVEQGFVLRGFGGSDRSTLLAVEIPDSELESLVVKNFTAQSKEGYGGHSHLCPTGYEDYFRSLGWHLDQHGGKKIGLTEAEDGFLVTYMDLPATSQGYIWTYRSFIDSKADIQNRLDEAFGRRARRR